MKAKVIIGEEIEKGQGIGRFMFMYSEIAYHYYREPTAKVMRK